MKPLAWSEECGKTTGAAVPRPSHWVSQLSARPAEAQARAQRARELLADCRLCAHECGVNRLAGEMGRCHAGAQARFFSAQTEVSDELLLMPTFSVALSGCDLRCDFCITGRESWDAGAGLGLDVEAMAIRAKAALKAGARSVMVLGGEPTIHLPAALDFVSRLSPRVKLVWKTNAHTSAQSRELLDGMFDVWLADFKFGNDACADRLAKVTDYGAIVKENLLWASARTELIVRHLLMPGHLECCWQPIAKWLAEKLPAVKVNLRTGFWPAWHARRHGELRGIVLPVEAESARQVAEAHGLNLVE